MFGIGGFGGSTIGRALVEITGSDSGLTRSLGQADAELRGFAKTGSSHMAGFAKATSTAFLAVGAAAVGLAAYSIHAYMKHQEAVAQLENVISKLPKLAHANIDAFVAQSKAEGLLTGTSHDLVLSADAVLARFNLTQGQIMKLIPVLLDYSRATGVDVVTAAGNVGRALMGNARALKAVGIAYTVATTQQDIVKAHYKDLVLAFEQAHKGKTQEILDYKNSLVPMEKAALHLAKLKDITSGVTTVTDLLQKKVHGAAAAFASTDAGKIAIMRERFHQTAETVGHELMPIFDKLLRGVGDLVGWFSKLSPATQGTVIKIGLLVGALGLVMKVMSPLLTLGGKLIGMFSGLGSAAGGAGAGAGAGLGGILAIAAALTAVLVVTQKLHKEETQRNITAAKAFADLQAGKITWSQLLAIEKQAVDAQPWWARPRVREQMRELNNEIGRLAGNLAKAQRDITGQGQAATNSALSLQHWWTVLDGVNGATVGFTTHVADLTNKIAINDGFMTKHQRGLVAVDLAYAHASAFVGDYRGALRYLNDAYRISTGAAERNRRATQGAGDSAAVARGKTNAYNIELRRVPRRVSTKVEVVGVAAYSAAVRSMIAADALIPRQVSTVVSTTSYVSTTSGARASGGVFPGYAAGVVTRPTLMGFAGGTALVGEGRYATPWGRGAEAVLPLNDTTMTRLATALANASPKARGLREIAINVTVNGYTGDPARMARLLGDEIVRRMPPR